MTNHFHGSFLNVLDENDLVISSLHNGFADNSLRTKRGPHTIVISQYWASYKRVGVLKNGILNRMKRILAKWKLRFLVI